MTATLPDLTPPLASVSLLAVDPDFARAVPAADHELAGRALTLPARAYPAAAPVVCADDEVALVITRGAVWRELRVGHGTSPQLLGPGAVLLCDPRPAELLSPTMRATAVTPTEVAVLDRRFLMAAARWPQLVGVVHGRVADQQRDLAVQGAICQFPRVDDRIVGLLWHLAERWGRVGRDGVRLPLGLTHATLGRFVGARRPTVSLALAELRERGLVDRDEDGCWILRGDPPGPVAGAAVPPADVVARLL